MNTKLMIEFIQIFSAPFAGLISDNYMYKETSIIITTLNLQL